jgi:hypothetical protein
MKSWFTRTFLLLALIGHLGHSFHVHHHDDTVEPCPICIVDDLSKIILDHTIPSLSIQKVAVADILINKTFIQSVLIHYHNRAPPLS